MTNNTATSTIDPISAHVQSRIDEFKKRLALETFSIAKRIAREIYDNAGNLTGHEYNDLYGELNQLVQATKPIPTESSIREELSALTDPDDLRVVISEVLIEIKIDQRLEQEERTRLIDLAKTFYPSLDEASINQMFYERRSEKKPVSMRIIRILMNDKRLSKKRRTALLDHLAARIAEVIGEDATSAFMDEESAKYETAPATTMIPEAYDPPEDAILNRMELLRGQMEDSGIETDDEGLRAEAIRQLTYEQMQKAA